MMTPKTLAKLKAFFAEHKIEKRLLVEKSGYTRRHVDYVLNNDGRTNATIIKLAVEIYTGFKQKQIKL